MSHRANSLDSPLPDFRRDLDRCVDLIIERYRTLYEANCHPGNTPADVHAWFDEPLPDVACDVPALLKRVEETVVANPTMNIGTKMFAYVMSGGTQVSILADFLASALDQNPAKWHLGPSMTEIERRVVAWTCEFIGLDSKRGGAIVSGGSAANLTGLTVARNLFVDEADVARRGLYGMQPLICYASDQTHSSVDKSIAALGLGTDNVRKIPTDDDFSIDVDALVACITRDRANGLRPFCLIGNAGTVNTGTIDPLNTMADIAQAEGLWFHVDGAYGGLAASLAKLRPHYKGLSRADSIALDYHKWLYQPFEVGCTLVRDWDALRRSFEHTPAYLDYGAGEGRFDISRHHFALSRNAKAFKVWMSFKAYGARRIRTMIAKDIELADYLAAALRGSPDFSLISRQSLAIVCFCYHGGLELELERSNELTRKLLEVLENDGRVFITGTVLKGREVLRACIINHRMAQCDIDYLLATMRNVGRKLVA